jgi:ribosomal protein L21E
MKYLIFIFFIQSFVFAQKDDRDLLKDQVLKFDDKTRKAGNYSCYGQYAFFNSPTDNDTVFKSPYSLVFDKKRALLNIQQMQHQIIQNEKVMLIIDTSTMQVIVNHPNKEFLGTISSVNNQNMDKWVQEIKLKEQAKQRVYSITYKPGVKFEKVELVFDFNGEIKKVVSYAGYEVPDATQGIDVIIRPRMELHIKSIALGDKVSTKSMLTVEAVYDAENKALTPEFQNFQLIDLRFDLTKK